jgi:hypothetical protein
MSSTKNSPASNKITMSYPVCLFGKQYRLLRIASSVFRAVSVREDGEEYDPRSGKEVAIKIKDIRGKHRPLQAEHDVHHSLKGGIGIPFVHSYETTNNKEVMMMDLLGPSLEDLFGLCQYKLTLKTVLLLADQLIPLIQYIHSHSLICEAGNPKNWAVGLGKFGNMVYLTNFKLAKFRHSDSGPSLGYNHFHTALTFV